MNNKRMKVLFLIHDLSVGGAEKVLVNLVNNMDAHKFDVTVMTLFDVGVNKQYLKSHITYRTCFSHMVPGNSHLLKLLTPKQLHRWLIKETYDVEIAYLEGPSARVISGCEHKNTTLLSWIHIEQKNKNRAKQSFRTYGESKQCYETFDHIVCVSEEVRQDFLSLYPTVKKTMVLYNTNETSEIIKKSKEPVVEFESSQTLRLIGVGKVIASKGFERLARIHCKLREQGVKVHTYILGMGKQQEEIQRFVEKKGMEETFTFLGYQTNPYKYIAKCDLFVCASYAEGFSTAATEALILGTPVCTVQVSGMKELLGEQNEYGVIVANEETALYEEVLRLLQSKEQRLHYKKQAILRGETFKKEETVNKVEQMLLLEGVDK